MHAASNHIEGFEVPVHRALTEPILLGGAPRAIAILNGTVAAAIGLGLQQWPRSLDRLPHPQRPCRPPRPGFLDRACPASAPARVLGMLNLSEYRPRADRLADHLPWAALVAPGIVLNKDSSFQRSFAFRGPDLESLTEAELVGICARANNALKRVGSGWAMFFEAERIEAQHYPRSQFPDPVSWLVDEERRTAFEAAGKHFESRYHLTLLFLPAPDGHAQAQSALLDTGRKRGEDGATEPSGGRFEAANTGSASDRPGRRIVGRNPSGEGRDWRQELVRFRDETDRLADLLSGLLPEIRALDDAETLTFLHGTISTRRHPVAVPENPIYLDAILADTPLAGGLEPMLGEKHLRTLTILGFPNLTRPGILDALNRLDFEYRWVTRFIPLDRTEATKTLTRLRRQWFAKRKSIAALLREVLYNEPVALLDSDADNKVADADLALQALGGDHVGFGYLTATVTVANADRQQAAEKLRAVEAIINGLGFTSIRETANAVEAWLGSLPGHVYANVRQPLVHTLNLAHLMPLPAVWAGPARNADLASVTGTEAPPLLYAETGGATPFRLSTHVGDVGHMLVVGPTGAGKSVLLALMALQFRRYRGSQVYIFDKGNSARAAVLAMGGAHHALGAAVYDTANALTFQPLRNIDNPATRGWAAEWIVGLLVHENVTVTPEVKEAVWSALGSLASAPAEERTLTGFCVLIQSIALKAALQPYTLDGPFGHLLDANESRLALADVQCFETEELLLVEKRCRLTYDNRKTPAFPAS